MRAGRQVLEGGDPLHFEGWAHFTQGADELKGAFSGNGIRDCLLMLDRGQRAEV